MLFTYVLPTVLLLCERVTLDKQNAKKWVPDCRCTFYYCNIFLLNDS